MADFLVSTTAFHQGGEIPQKYSCDGQNISPPVSWTAPPSGTRSIALIFEDPDAPSGLFVHWVVYNLPPSAGGLVEGVEKSGKMPAVLTQGRNGAGSAGYRGPCPPPGPAHRYFFRIYALNMEPALPAGLSAQSLREMMESHILAETETMGKYQRQR